MTENAGITELIKAVEEADSAERLTNALWKLAQARSPSAIPTLIEALGFNNPGAAVAGVEGLVALGEIAIVPLLEQLDGFNYGARAWALRALAKIGDPRGLELLLETAAHDFALSVRRAAATGLGNILWEKMDPEERVSAQEKVYQTLLEVLQDPEWVVRYAAVVGMQGLATAALPNSPMWLRQLLTQLGDRAKSDEELVVRARAQLAYQQLQVTAPA
ncbi:HEAT repeat domain-containing protein [Phormidium pseudopriestleyi FRX01]|uniref:HEAT repeat domain-containing protein n=1 Tax=Phormidium pseudopriestleyi FRX01 TaxID=1759528 RepID=A0ABS3FUB4_9CYAN|nr:HEAT repeat domain-containing protein [Phormidium pseudopriestleyi]MBO0350432.1 HEAT repeat domain-containing protein [Phormidium pseudopriestleyi FRX01]